MGGPVGSSRESEDFWVTRHATTILFCIILLSVAGIFLAGKIPISVFPDTNFPRVVIGVDNGVMPVRRCGQLRARSADRPVKYESRLRRG